MDTMREMEIGMVSPPERHREERSDVAISLANPCIMLWGWQR